jgi:hypothetical protein
MDHELNEEKRDKNLLIVRYNHAAALLDVSPDEKYFYIS